MKITQRKDSHVRVMRKPAFAEVDIVFTDTDNQEVKVTFDIESSVHVVRQFDNADSYTASPKPVKKVTAGDVLFGTSVGCIIVISAVLLLAGCASPRDDGFNYGHKIIQWNEKNK